MDYDELLNRCLSKMPSDLDIREGSFIYTAIAPLCYELAQAYFEFENILNLAFLDTSYGDYLDKLVYIVGIERNSAVKCRKLAEIITNDDIIGEKFSCDEYIFTIIENVSQNNYIIEATEYGLEYNSIFGNLYSIMNLTGVSSAKIIENYILATEIEDDEELRERAIERILYKPFGGNIPDYKEKTLLIDGVSEVFVFTANDLGLGNVHLVISGAENTPLSEQICENCSVYFNGTVNLDANAPIGHSVTVSTIDYVYIDISCKIKINEGENQELVIINAKKQLENYISSLNFENTTVSRMKMISYLLQLDEIYDIDTFFINGSEENFILSKTYSKFEICRINSTNITF